MQNAILDGSGMNYVVMRSLEIGMMSETGIKIKELGFPVHFVRSSYLLDATDPKI